MEQYLKLNFFKKNITTTQAPLKNQKKFMFEKLIKNNIYNFNKQLKNLISSNKNHKKFNFAKICPRSPTLLI